MAIFDQENKNLIFSCKFFSILGHQILDPDPGSGSGIRIRNPDLQLEKMLDPDPH
jgi:hypothetical protein